jgi:hypothetical protein
MKAWDITLDSNHDVDGNDWLLRVRTEDCEGSDCEFIFHLPADVAEALHRQVKLEIDPYVREKEEARAAYATRHPDWMPREVRQAEAQELLDSGVYDDDPAKRAWAESEASA